MGHLFFVPVIHSYRVASEPSRGDKLLNGFPDRSRWVELQEKILQGRQHFCRVFPCELLKGGCNTWQKLPGYVKILQCGKWI
jgi:hypothetical protein